MNLLSAGCGMLFVHWIACGVFAEQTRDASWRAEAEPRLQRIYEQGAMRPRPFAPEWLPDSTGYVVRETDEASQRSVSVRYDTRTGAATELEDFAARVNPRRSPEGSRVLETSEGQLAVRDRQTGTRQVAGAAMQVGFPPLRRRERWH